MPAIDFEEEASAGIDFIPDADVDFQPDPAEVPGLLSSKNIRGTYQELVKPFIGVGIRQLDRAGRFLAALGSDIKELILPPAIPGEPTKFEAFRNIAAFSNEPDQPLPIQEDVEKEKGIKRFIGKAALGLLEMEPKLAASVLAAGGAGAYSPIAGYQALGRVLGSRLAGESIVTGVSAALPFSITEEGDVDIKNMAILSALPAASALGGKVATSIASKYPGVSSESAKRVVEGAGGLLSANAYLLATQTPDILKLPPDEREQAVVDSMALNLGPSVLGLVGMFGTPAEKQAVAKERTSEVAPLTAEAVAKPTAPVPPPAVPAEPSLAPLTDQAMQVKPAPVAVEKALEKVPAPPEAAPDLPTASVESQAPPKAVETPVESEVRKVTPETAAEATNLPSAESQASVRASQETITGSNEQKGSEMPAEPGSARMPPGPETPPRTTRGTDRIPDILDALAGEGIKIDIDAARKFVKGIRPTGASRKVFRKGGQQPDDALGGLQSAGHYPGIPDEVEFINAVLRAGEARKSFRAGQSPEAKALKAEEAQQKDFTDVALKNKRPPAEKEKAEAIAVSELLEGDEFLLASTKVKVKELVFDPETTDLAYVVLEDGRRFGVKTVGAEELIYPDPGSLKRTEASTEFVPQQTAPSEQGTAVAQLRSGENQGDLLAKVQEPFALTGEKAIDFDRLQAQKAKAEQESAEARAIEAEQQTSMFGASPGAMLAPSAPSINLPPKSRRQIITDISRGLEIPIRFGRLKTSKFGGYFMKLQNLIGAKRANDIEIVSHEAGHKLDDMLSLSGTPALRSELDVLGDPGTPGSRSSWTPSKSKKYKLGEGVAEFLRYWLVEPTQAQALAPSTYAHFEKVIQANKDLGDFLRQTQSDIKLWRTATPEARIDSSISVGENPNKTRYTVSQLTRDMVDDLHILRLATDDAQKLSGSAPLPSQNPYLLARTLRGSYGMADTFVRSGTVDFNSKAVKLGNSLEDALRPVSGKIDAFRRYIVSRQAKELSRQGKETGLDPADVDFVLNKYAGDAEFQTAFEKLKRWNDSLLQYAVDAGYVSAESAASMRAINQDYVPFHRVFEVGAGESPSMESTGTGRGLNLGKIGSVKGRHGSTRDIVDPLETMIKNAYAVITASEKNAINISVADWANSPGMGKWVEPIATPKEQVRVGIEKIREELEAAGADLTGVPDDLLLTFYQGSGHAPFGENIIKIVRNGKPEFFRLNKDLFETFHALNLDDAGQLIKILSEPGQVLRAGVTLTPDFALANLMRDAFSSSVIGKYGALPFEATLRGVGALINKPNLVAEWKAAGGHNAIEANYFDRPALQKFMREKITKDFTPGEKATLILKSPLAALRIMGGAMEEATRIGEYEIAYRQMIKSGLPPGEARRMAAFEARDRQDFAKGGAKTKILRHITPFWNAALQSNVKLAQAFHERPIRTIAQGVAFVTLPKLLEQAVNWDDPDYWDRPQWERDLFFLIPYGKDQNNRTEFFRIPTPFEVGVIFGTFPGRILESVKKNDPEALKSFPGMMLRQSVPNPIPQSLQAIYQNFFTGPKGWDLFRGRQIVPESLVDFPPDMQWTEQTSLTAKKLGKLLDFSPIKIDHLIGGLTGGLGKQVTHQILDRAISVATGEPAATQPVVPGGRFVTVPAGIQSQAVTDFYEHLNKLRSESKRPGAALGILPAFEAASIRMSIQRGLARQAKDADAKQRYYLEIARIAQETNQLISKKK